MPATRTDPSTKVSRARYKDSAICDECGCVLSRKADLARHKQGHLDNKSKQYKYCPREGCDWHALQGLGHHLRTHDTPKPCVCPDCDKDYVDPSSLLRHRKKLHGYVPRKTTRAGGSDPTPKQRRRPRELPNRVASAIAEGSGSAEASTSFSTFRVASYPSAPSTPSDSTSNASSPLSSCPSTPSADSRPATPISTPTTVFNMAAPMNPQVILPNDAMCSPYALSWNWTWTKNELSIDNPFVAHQEDVFEYLQPPTGPQFWMQPMDTYESPVDQLDVVEDFQCTPPAPSPDAFDTPATFPGYGATGSLDFNSPELAELAAVFQEILAADPLAFQPEEPQPIFKMEFFPEQAAMVPGNNIDFSFLTKFDSTPDLQPAESFSPPAPTTDFTAIPQLFADNSEALDVNDTCSLSALPPSTFYLNRLEFNTGMPGIGADVWKLGFNVNTFGTGFN